MKNRETSQCVQSDNLVAFIFVIVAILKPWIQEPTFNDQSSHYQVERPSKIEVWKLQISVFYRLSPLKKMTKIELFKSNFTNQTTSTVPGKSWFFWLVVRSTDWWWWSLGLSSGHSASGKVIEVKSANNGNPQHSSFWGVYTLLETNISQLGKRQLNFKSAGWEGIC